MKNLFPFIGLVILFGAGCAPQPPSSPITPTSTASPTPAPAPVVTPDPPQRKDPPTTPIINLKEAPPVVPTDQPLEDDSKWATLTRNGVTATYPTTGPNAMKLTMTLLANDDPRLQNGCFVTKATVSKRTNFPNYDLPKPCQTITAFGAGAGTRVDYFVLGRHLITMSKTYPAGFDMDGYDRIVEKVINILD